MSSTKLQGANRLLTEALINTTSFPGHHKYNKILPPVKNFFYVSPHTMTCSNNISPMQAKITDRNNTKITPQIPPATSLERLRPLPMITSDRLKKTARNRRRPSPE